MIAYRTCLNVRSVNQFALQVTGNHSRIFSNCGVDLYTGNTFNDAISGLKMRVDLYTRSTYTRGRLIHKYIRYYLIVLQIDVLFGATEIASELNYFVYKQNFALLTILPLLHSTNHQISSKSERCSSIIKIDKNFSSGTILTRYRPNA